MDFEFALGGLLGGSWDAGVRLEIPHKTIAFAPLNLSPIGCTEPRFVKDFGLTSWLETKMIILVSSQTAATFSMFHHSDPFRPTLFRSNLFDEKPTFKEELMFSEYFR